MKHFWHLLFIPHEKNNHRALLLHPSFIGIFIALYLLNQSFIRSLTIVRPGILGYSSEITAQKVLDLSNQQRSQLHLTPLKYNQTLTNSAIHKAQDMFDHNYWAHTSPQGKSPWEFLHEAGYEYSVAGENLAKDFYDTESLLKAWMNSSTHRANLVNSKYQDIGIGVVNGILNGVKTTLVVQHFGTPLKSPVNPAIPTRPQYTRLQYSQSSVLSESTNNLTENFISPLQISQAIGVAMFVFIIALLFLDAYHTLRHPANRLIGSSAGHVSFLAIILLLLIFSHQGAIF